jgi:hypothetical protein
VQSSFDGISFGNLSQGGYLGLTWDARISGSAGNRLLKEMYSVLENEISGAADLSNKQPRRFGLHQKATAGYKLKA